MLNVLDPDEIAMLQPKVSHSYTGRMLREGADFLETLGDNSPFILILDNRSMERRIYPGFVEFSDVQVFTGEIIDHRQLPALRG